MESGKIRIAILGLILANIIWGASFPIYKWTLEVVPPFTFAFLRFFLGALILLPFVYKTLKIAKEDRLKVIFVSFIGITILIPLIFFGLRLTPSINAPIIFALGPIFLIIAAVVFLKENLRAKALAGTIISLLGVLGIILRPVLEEGLTGGVLGNLLLFLATLISVTTVVMLKGLTKRNNFVTLGFWIFLIGSLPLLPLVFMESQSFNLNTGFNTQALIGVAYGVIFSTVIAHTLLIYGLRYIKASEVGVFTYVDPIAAILIAIPLLGEVITLPYIIGAMLVFLGIFIAEGRLHYHPFHMLKVKDP